MYRRSVAEQNAEGDRRGRLSVGGQIGRAKQSSRRSGFRFDSRARH
jgi:hypothetical protein